MHRIEFRKKDNNKMMLSDHSCRKTEAFGSDTARSLHNKERNQSSVFCSGSGVRFTIKYVLTSYPLGLRKAKYKFTPHNLYIQILCINKKKKIHRATIYSVFFFFFLETCIMNGQLKF